MDQATRSTCLHGHSKPVSPPSEPISSTTVGQPRQDLIWQNKLIDSSPFPSFYTHQLPLLSVGSEVNCMGSGCGSVGRAVASITRDPRFESRHRHNCINQLYNRKHQNKEKEAGNGPSLKSGKIADEKVFTALGS